MPMLKKWLRRGLILLAVTTFILSVPMTAVHAALVNHSFSFTGALDPDPAFGSVPVTGSFQLTPVPGSSPGGYTGAVTGFTLNILVPSPGQTHRSFFTSGANAVTISKNIDLGSGSNGDRWELVTAAQGDQILDGTVMFTPVSFNLSLDRVMGGLFSDTSLQDPPSFSTLINPRGVTGRWHLLFEDMSRNGAEYAGSINSLTAVPLPTSVVLFSIGLILLVGLGAGRRRHLLGFQV